MRANVHSIELGGVTNLAVLAPIKAGFVPGFETITYLERLRRLLSALHAARQNVRESELNKPVFADPIGRAGIIRDFRYAIVPPDPVTTSAGEPGISRLSLNVSFDGGWEPYMRVIYRDIGALLDALFCHCERYPGSHKATFDEYCRWVRDREIDAGLYYTDSSMSVADQRYLAEVERLQHDTPHPERADEAIAKFALETETQRTARAIKAMLANPVSTLALPLRTLKGLYRLAPFFPNNGDDDGDHGVLVRFAQLVLKEFKEVIGRPELRNSPLWRSVAAALVAELDWFASPQATPLHEPRLTYSPTELQDMILSRNDPVTHGCVVMLAVSNLENASSYLGKLAGFCEKPTEAAAIRHHVAFTHAGLMALGIAEERLDVLPQEFAEGMEARCGLLGDVRGNHPDRWQRPLRHPDTKSGERIDLTAVHVVVVLRLIDKENPGWTLPQALTLAVEALQADSTGLTVLAVQPTRSYRDAEGRTREHFGFVDGISQPKAVEKGEPAPRGDEVSLGELLLGYRNDRDSRPFPKEPDDLLDNGSFLVMRKLRQRVDHLSAALGQPQSNTDVLTKMMGRREDGTPLVPFPAGQPNEFNYDADREGAACPFHSHVRRANPRDGREYMPRILRRGMSYGPRTVDGGLEAERGVVFMAYCASIAEQFETIQRWIAGGNSSGVSSSQADPFMTVPQVGERRTFRYLDAAGKVARVDLGDKPFVELEWGLYLFVPSLKALRSLTQFREKPEAPYLPPHKTAPADPLQHWRERLEDTDRSKAAWNAVRLEHSGRLKAPPYGTLVGTLDGVLTVLRDGGAKYSVQGYGKRMAASIGLNHLGMDRGGARKKQAPPVNAAIEAIGERQAFEAATPLVAAVLKRFDMLKQPDPTGPARVPIDLVSLSESVLAGLCTKWVGLPEKDEAIPHGQELMVRGGRVDKADGLPRCPGHLLTASRFIFAPHPRPNVDRDGPPQGKAVLVAVEALLASGRPLGTLAITIRDELTNVVPASELQDVVARNIAGVLLGFPPTVHGNFLQTMKALIEKEEQPLPEGEPKQETLWDFQQRLANVPAEVTDRYERAKQALRKPLLATMRKKPVPEMLWRCPVVKGAVVHDESQRVVLGIASALTEAGAPDELMFGGSRDSKSGYKTEHACPGYGMGVGVLLALLAGLLEAGTLRPTGSPVLLMLTPRGS
ncbi:MAG: Dyp-type peroxidase [Burkholderiales bacterium]